MQQNFKQLKRSRSLHVTDGMSVIWPRLENPGKINVNKITKNGENERKFANDNGVIAYVYDGELYVTPYARDVIPILDEAGFAWSSNLHVPFSNGDLPQCEAILEKWERLKASVVDDLQAQLATA